MSIIIKKINNVSTGEIPRQLGGEIDNRPILGHELFPDLYANIYICSKKFSGKSTTIFHVIKHCCSRNSQLYVFSSTILKDDSWIKTRKYCKSKGIALKAYTTIKDGKTKQNILEEIMDNIGNVDQEVEEESGDEDDTVDMKKLIKSTMVIRGDSDTDEEDAKPRKPKFQSPENFFIFDDISSELRSPAIAKLLKQNRHYKSKVIISSQFFTDIAPGSRNQLDYWLIFKGHPINKLEEIWKACDLKISFPRFIQIYELATKEKFNFLYIDRNREKFRINFNKEITLDAPKET